MLFSNTIVQCFNGFSLELFRYLGDNQFTGELPDAWAALTALPVLYVLSFFFCFFNLTGNVLFYRHLYDNQLTGELPDSWSALFALQELYAPYSSVFKSNLTGNFLQQIFERESIHWRTSCFLVCSLQFAPNVLFLLSYVCPLFQLLNQSQRVLHSNQLSGPIPATWFPVPPAFPYLQHLCVSVFFCFFFYIFLTVHSKITVHKSIEWTTSFQLVCFVQSPIFVCSFCFSFVQHFGF